MVSRRVYHLFSFSRNTGCYTGGKGSIAMEKKRGSKKKIRMLFAIGAVLLLLAALPFALSGFVVLRTQGRIIDAETAAGGGYDCILVLGAGVWGEGEAAYPSHMLEDRLKTALSLYDAGASEKLLMSGDHGRAEYDEVNVMKNYAMACGVASNNVFMDHAGFSTYESMYRARDVFKAQKVLIVTQEYHLYRAVYVANALGLDAYGVSADLRPYAGQRYYNLREVLARCKDLCMTVFQPEPTYLGETIPVSGDGDLTNG